MRKTKTIGSREDRMRVNKKKRTSTSGGFRLILQRKRLE